jgi:2-polyprenyl-6-methoxyphenol hydroxylase-like FAD-dependent oxidoreductase
VIVAMQTTTSPPATAASDADRVVVIGAGMAGSLLSLVLGRAGYPVTLVDVKRDPPSDFRNEKLGIDQIERLKRLGVLSCFEEACWGDDAAGGDGVPLKDCGARYDRWIARVRAALPGTVSFVEGKVDQIETSADRQVITLSNGETITARLAALATGRGERLRSALGVTRQIVSDKHSICLGFSVAKHPDVSREMAAQICYGQMGDRIAYVTIFPMLEEVRVNIFSYRDADDPWIREMREDPIGVLTRTLPETRAALSGREIVRKLEVRGTDLYAVNGHVQDGIVLLGDAFQATCPSSGTGVTRILNDVERLTQAHIPNWFATPGVNAEKIGAFYADPIKQAVDKDGMRRSIRGRKATLGTAPYWRARRTVAAFKRAFDVARANRDAVTGA